MKILLEKRKQMTNEIKSFVEKYNDIVLPKYQFQQNDNHFIWKYKISDIELFIMIENVKDGLVELNCTRDGLYFTKINLSESPYGNMNQTLYNFLSDSISKTEALVDAENEMNF